MVRDEVDIVPETVGRMCDQTDLVIVADNGSTDGTREILQGLPLVLVDDPELGYYQSQKMSRLADMARREGAEWVIPFDADEAWLAHNGHLGRTLKRLPREAMVAHAPIFDHVATATDGDGPPVERMVWRRSNRLPLPKVAFRPVPDAVVHQGNHGVDLPGHRVPLVATDQLEVRHFPYRSQEQFIRKVRNGAQAYRATDLPEEVGGHWRRYDRFDDDGLREIFAKWFYRERPDEPLRIDGEAQPPLVRDPVPVCEPAL
jgi:glycosyltransferase involved in cell wall biosynthesis